MLRALAMLLSAFLLPSLAVAEEVRVVIYPVVRLDADPGNKAAASVRLARLARIVADRETTRALQSVPVPTRAFRGATQIDGQLLKGVLAALPELADAEILNPERISVAPVLAPARLEDAVVKAEQALLGYIADTWPERYRNIKLRHVSGERQSGLGPTESYHFDFSALAQLRSRTPVWLVVDGKTRSRRVALWFEVTGERLVWEALERLDSRAVAEPGAFVQRWRNLSEPSRGQLAEPDSGQRMVATMAPGDILTRQHLEPVPDVDYGADIRVISRVGDVKIETIAMALETAFAGDVISLRSKSSDEQFEGRVMERNLVQIERFAEGKRTQQQSGE